MKALALIAALLLTSTALGMIKTADGSIILSPVEAAGLAGEIKAMREEITNLRNALGDAESRIERCREIKV